jgi:polysaccharide biosynthesis protein PslH
MKVLVISSYLPYPLLSGGQVRLYNLIKELSKKHEITLICEKRPHQTAQDVAQVKKICKEVITVNRKKQWSISNIAKAGLSFKSFLLTGHTQAQFKDKIQKTLSDNKFDLIHVETYYVMENLPQTTLPIVLVEHNIEYSVYEKFKSRAPAFLRPLLSLDIAKIKKEEEDYWKKAKALVAVSIEDQQVMRKTGLAPFLVPNGVNTAQFKFKEKIFGEHGTKKILYLGDFKWIQNRDAATYIIKEIWPLIKKIDGVEKFGLKLWIVGRKIPQSIRRLTDDPDILFDEESSSLPTENIFQESALLLAPIRVGGGTSYKILESMSSGTPVVSMQMSADALGAHNEHDLMVGQNEKELAEKSLQLLSDESLYREISKNGRELVEKNYTWEEIGKKLDEVYKSSLQIKV